jgi:hypothetical protein
MRISPTCSVALTALLSYLTHGDLFFPFTNQQLNLLPPLPSLPAHNENVDAAKCKPRPIPDDVEPTLRPSDIRA